MKPLADTAAYQSPWTGITYDIVSVPQSRVDYHEYMNPETRYIREYTRVTNSSLSHLISMLAT
jgi:hypothetical protein